MSGSSWIQGESGRVLMGYFLDSTGTKSESGEMVNELAVANLLKIEQRITGQISGVSDSVALSVQGEVNYLIREATTERNLARM